MKNLIRLILLPVLALAAWPPTASAKDIVSYSHVLEDGSLMVSGQKIWLYGIFIPLDDYTCRTYEVPIKCGQRALLALEFKIEPFFVSCDKKQELEDGSITALCRVKGVDLSAWMLREGWAIALPDAPFEYKALEEIARHNNRGIWGTITGPP